MGQSKTGPQAAPPKQRKKRRGYIPKSNAVCVTIHSLNGEPISEQVAEDILKDVNDKALTYGLLINFTRT